jgi:hypothetical protein
VPLDLTLGFLALSLLGTGLSIWQIRRKREIGRPSLIDWHYVLFPVLILTILLVVHATNLLLGR